MEGRGQWRGGPGGGAGLGPTGSAPRVMGPVDPGPPSGGWGGSGLLGGAVLTAGLTPTTLPRPQLALNIGNTRFNEIMEAQLPARGGPKPSAESDM